MTLRRTAPLALLALLAIVGSSMSAAAQVVLTQLQCRGEYQGSQIQGIVVADLWRFTTGGADVTTYIPFLRRGELHRIPGTVRLFGNMRDTGGNLINFEVFLQQTNRGTGSFWVNGARHRETHMQLAMTDAGFDIFPETGGVARFACQR